MSMYDDNGDMIPLPEGMIEVRIEKGGETIKTRIPEGSTIQALIRDGHLQGITTGSTRINGAPATVDTALQSGDEVCQVPTSGKQG